jgi:hypothetical protein
VPRHWVFSGDPGRLPNGVAEQLIGPFKAHLGMGRVKTALEASEIGEYGNEVYERDERAFCERS